VTFDEARDAMLAVFKAAWDPKPAHYVDVTGSVPPTDPVVWARVKIKHVDGRQGSLTGGLGTTIYDRLGFVWIQVFAPVGDGMKLGYAASQSLVNAYQAERGSIWYRNVRMSEMGPDGAFERFDVKADFEYRDVR
jgi:hypothetical protein